MAPSSSPPLRFHWLRLRATAHPTEDPDRVAAAMAFLSGLDESPEPVRTTLDTHHGAKAVRLDVELTRARDIRGALAVLLPDPSAVAQEVDTRTDEDGVFYLRYDKQEAFLGRARRCRHDDCVQVRLKPEVHPAGRERAVGAMRDWLASDA